MAAATVCALLMASCSAGDSADDVMPRSASSTDAPATAPSTTAVDPIAELEQALADRPPAVDLDESWSGSLLRGAGGDEVDEGLISAIERVEADVLAGLRAQAEAQALEASGAATVQPTPAPLPPSSAGSSPSGFRSRQPVGGALVLYMVLLDGLSGAVSLPQGVQYSSTDSFAIASGTGSMHVGVDAQGVVTVQLDSTFEVTSEGRTGTVTLNAGTSGRLCPADDGVLELRFNGTARATWGDSGRSDQRFDGVATVQFGDDGEVATVEIAIDIEAARTSSSTGSSYVELTYGDQVTYGADRTRSDVRDVAVSRSSSQFQPGNAADELMSLDAIKVAGAFAEGLVALRTSRVQNNGCVVVEAQAPSTATSHQAVQVEVRTRHKLDGVELDKRVAATLSGPGSIDPGQLPRTVGTITYTAGDKAGDAGTITLESRSRRGIGRTSLTITVLPSFRVDQPIGDLRLSGKVCGFDTPFTLDSADPMPGSITFTPSGSGGGSFAGSGQVGDTQGVIETTGTYTVEGADTERPTIRMSEGTTKMTNLPIVGEAPLPGFWQGEVTLELIADPAACASG